MGIPCCKTRFALGGLMMLDAVQLPRRFVLAIRKSAMAR
jgi:hypothetical protein